VITRKAKIKIGIGRFLVVPDGEQTTGGTPEGQSQAKPRLSWFVGMRKLSART